MHIGKDTIVALRYVMYNSNGVVLEDTMQAAPVNYLHGSAGILPLLQAQLEGLHAGDKKKVHLLKESNLTNEDFTFDVVIDKVRAALPEEIMLGYPVKISLDKCTDDCACYT